MIISYLDALQITINCMLIVFFVLLILMGVVSLFKYIPEIKLWNKKNTKKRQKYVPFEDMDEDTKVAVLVATIHAKNETNNEMKLKSVRRI